MDSGPWLIVMSWPDVPENLLVSDYHAFTKYFDILDKEDIVDQISHCTDVEVKNIDKAEKFRMMGNKCFSNHDYKEAMKLYNNSIAHAPHNSVEFGLAVANRSAVLFDLEKYEECLVDIDRILVSEYKKDLLYKIFFRQSNCYLKLKLNSEAANSMQKVQECIDKLNLDEKKMSSLNKKLMDIKIQLKEQLEPKAPDNIPNDYIEYTEQPLNLKCGENPKFVCAARVVKFQYTNQLGRHVVANAEINKGDTLFVEEPYSFVKFDKENRDEIHFTLCCYCLQRSLNCIPCKSCTTFFYCSEDCRKNSWEFGHRWTCLAYRRKILTIPTHQLCLASLFKASRDGFKTAVEDESVYGNKENNYPFFNKLITHSIDLCGLYVQAAVWMAMYLKKFTDYFDWLMIQPNRPAGSEDDLFKFVGGQLVKYQLQSRCNSVYLLELKEGKLHCPSKQINRSEVGFGIYVSTALLNHSCVPNAVHSFHNAKRVVKALKDIKKGQEITLNYVNERCDFYGPVKSKGLEPELGRFSFKCNCRACTEPDYKYQYLPLVCLRCGGKSIPLVNDKSKAKCRDCNDVFNTDAHNSRKGLIGDILNTIEQFNNTCEVEQEMLCHFYKLLSKTFHKHSVAYFKYYDCCWDHYGKTGNITKLIETVKSSLDVLKVIWGDTSEDYLANLLTLAYTLATYSIILRKQNALNYGAYLDKTIIVIKETINLAHYYFPPTLIKDYVANITKYLNSDNEKIVGCVLNGCNGHKQNSLRNF